MIRTSPGRLLPPLRQGPGNVAVCTKCPNMPVAGSWLPAWTNAVAWRRARCGAAGQIWTNRDFARALPIGGNGDHGRNVKTPSDRAGTTERARSAPVGRGKGPPLAAGRSEMKIGIGLPAAIPDVTATAVGEWAASAEQLGFSSVSVIDWLVYDNLDPLIALAAAAEPAPDTLAPYVTCLWEHRIGGGDLAYDQPILPDGCIDLVAVDGTLSWPVRRLAR